MTTTSATPARTDAVEADHAAVRRALVPVGVAAVVVCIALSWTFANSVAESLVKSAAAVVLGGLLFGLFVPRGLRRPSAGGRALAVAVVALVLGVLAWWSAVPLVIGGAAALLGAAGRRADRGSATAIAALVVGLLAVVGDATMFLLDGVWFH